MTDPRDQYWKFPLPDDLEPDGFWCVTVAIPGDQQYMDTFAGAIGALTQWRAFPPDATRAAARTVAHTWEVALYRNPFIVVQGCQNPEPPPIPDQAAADDQAAAIIILLFQHVVSELNSCAPDSAHCAGCVDSLMSELAPYGAGDAVRGALVNLCRDLNALGSTQRAQYETDCPYRAQFDDLRQHIANNPYDWLNHLTDWLFDWLNHTSNQLFVDLNTIAGLLGGGAVQQYVQDHGGGGGGAGFGASCPWRKVFDFTTGAHGWEVSHPDPTSLFGEYTSDVGFEDTYLRVTDTGLDVRGVTMAIDVSIDELTSWQVEFTMVDGGFYTFPRQNFGLYSHYGSGDVVQIYPLNVFEGSDQQAVWTGSAACVKPGLNIECGIEQIPYGDPGGTLTITRIVLEGAGTEPTWP
jgi:hypothetical protein